MRKDPRVYLAQILERAERILHFTQEGQDAESRNHSGVHGNTFCRVR
jgi:uncharacterized protein with HEPN domain